MPPRRTKGDKLGLFAEEGLEEMTQSTQRGRRRRGTEAVSSDEAPADVPCPLCGLAFSLSKIEAHAASCIVPLDVLDTDFSDTGSDKAGGGHPRECPFCESMIPAKDYDAHVKEEMGSFDEVSSTWDAEDPGRGSDIIQVDDSDGEGEGGGQLRGLSPLRGYVDLRAIRRTDPQAFEGYMAQLTSTDGAGDIDTLSKISTPAMDQESSRAPSRSSARGGWKRRK